MYIAEEEHETERVCLKCASCAPHKFITEGYRVLRLLAEANLWRWGIQSSVVILCVQIVIFLLLLFVCQAVKRQVIKL